MQAIHSDLLLRLIAHSTEAIVFADMEGTVQYTNPAADELYRYEPGELIGRNVDIFNAQISHETDKIVEAIKNKGRWQGIIVQRRKDNTTFHSDLRVALILDDDGNPVGLGSHSRDVSGKLEAEIELKESEEKYRRLFESSQDGIFIHINERVIDANDRLLSMLGLTDRNGLAFEIDSLVHPDDRETIRRHIREGLESSYLIRAYHKQGHMLYLEMHGTNTTLNGRPARVVIVRDRTEKTLSDEKIKTALKEKEVLLGEIYHRTKNNMQVISSLLTLRAKQMDSSAVNIAFREITDKIQSMSLVHQKLYESRNLSSLRLDEYIEDLVHLMESGYATGERKIYLHFQMKPVTVLIDSAMACGLILSELLSNTFKHAFTGRTTGNIIIQLEKKSSETVYLEFADDGVGLEKEFDFQKAGGLGITTVIGIVESQLLGKVNFVPENGLRCIIEFEDNLHSSRI